MLIQKIVKVENVGRFAKLTGSGDVTFRKLTLLYGENGHGKTTVAGILRSLSTGDPAYLAERATLGAVGGQVVEILLGTNAVAKFASGTWSQTVTGVEIFDGTFVRENVYAGDSVDPEQRKNLYDVVVGAAGVKLRNQIDDLDDQNRKMAATLRRTEEDLQRHVQAPFTLDQFLKLTADAGVDEKIRAATTRLNALRNSKAILSRPKLQELRLPEAPRSIAELLAARVEQVALEAVERVKTHIQANLGLGGENWLRQGLQFPHDEKCPFCGQAAAGSDLLALFPVYFSTVYEERIVQLQRATNRLEQTLGERALSALRETVLENDAAIQGWKDMADLQSASISFDRIEKTWRHVFETLGERLRAKLASPTQASEDQAIVEAALRDFEEIAAACSKHNADIRLANDAIDGLRKDAVSSDEKTVEAELRTLRNSQIRQQPEVAELCDLLISQRSERARLTKEKEQARIELQKQAGDVLKEYEASINRYLERFGASFRMTGAKPEFPGGKASSVYQIEINGKAIELGDSRTKAGQVCFRTALSTGDRSTLALAFFLARLDRDPDIATKAIVLDDPLSSLDCFRSACTQQEITRITTKAGQVIVLSHDAVFLESLASETAGAKTLHISRKSGDYQIREWNVDEHCRSQAHKDYFMLKSFLDNGVPAGGDLASVARRIRPYVEDYVRHKYPGDFNGAITLGACIAIVKAAPGTTGPAAFKPKVPDLEDINNFGSRFMHSDGKPAPAPSEQELQAYADRAIRLVQSP